MKMKYCYPKFIYFSILDIKTRAPITNAVVYINDIQTDFYTAQSAFYIKPPFKNTSTLFTVKIVAEGYIDYEQEHFFTSLNGGEVLMTKIQQVNDFNVNMTWNPSNGKPYDLDLYFFVLRDGETDKNQAVKCLYYGSGNGTTEYKSSITVVDSAGTNYLYTLDYDDDVSQDPIKDAHVENISGKLCNEFTYLVSVQDVSGSAIMEQQILITITLENQQYTYECTKPNLKNWDVLYIKKNSNTGDWEFEVCENTKQIN